ncbi:MAG: nucleotide exchange factor GrpE [Firmicutes bacterium]|nr:nucleotide exchange factor GrpE [Bacillota bacterium]
MEKEKKEQKEQEKVSEKIDPNDLYADAESADAKKDAQDDGKPDAEPAAKEKERDVKRQNKALRSELEETKKELEDAKSKLSEQNDKYLRLAVEYDNYRRRSAKEREGIYGDAYSDAMKKLLPTLDDLERTGAYTDPEHIADGVKQTLKRLPDVLSSMGIEQYGEAGEKFDPNLHSAVSMVSDSDREDGEIVSVFQRGYRYGDRILRFAVVTVAGK